MPPETTKMMSNGGSTAAIAISANIPASSSTSVWSSSYPGTNIMEPIPEEEEIHSPLHNTTSPTFKTVEQVRRKREVYTSEQVDTLVSTLPKDLVPGEWKNLPSEEIVNDPIMAQTYVTKLPGQTSSARSTRKTYVYESHVDDPDSELLDSTAVHSYYPDDSLERHSHSTQKVTRVTKITTTRSIKQVPVDPSDIFFDADGNPTSNDYDGIGVDYDSDSLGIDLSHSCVTEHEELHDVTPLKSQQLDPQPSTSSLPSAPSRPDVVLAEYDDILLSWQMPEQSGTAGKILGYLVEFRRKDSDPWEPAHDELLVDNECRVSKLDRDSYYFRVSAANVEGFGLPSLSTHISQNRGEFLDKPRVLSVGNNRVLLEWDQLLRSKAPLSGYLIQYRTPQNQNWLPANDFPISATRFEVVNLRYGEYDFRVLARYEDGQLSSPSPSSGFVKIQSENLGPDFHTGQRLPQQYNPDITRPGKPQVIASDISWVRLRWNPSTSLDKRPLAYLVEVREVSDSTWFIVGPEPIASNEFIADNLDLNSEYQFKVSAMAVDGSQSMPSPVSDVINLNVLQQNQYVELNNLNGNSRMHGRPPERPSPCEYLDFDGGNSVTLCWLPAKSVLPVLGYQVEFRDIMQDPTSWYEVTENLVRSCKTTVGYLIPKHQYQFRIIAKNANGFSEPSDPSPLITIGSLLKETKYLEAERHAAVSLLQDEILRESPPLPERDDSPPPMNRQPNMSNLQYRDPTLREVIDYLKSSDENIVMDASGYLQHLTYNNDLIKEDTRQYGGIPLLIRLLQHRNSEIVRNACGSLKNLAFGHVNDVNKKAINADGGVKALAQVIKTTASVHVREESTGALSNISACDDLKEQVFHLVADVIVQYVVVPSSGMLRSLPPDHAKHGTATVFRNGTAILRNVSAVSSETRKLLRVAPNLIEALLFFLRSSIQRNQIDNRAVENVVCILRNLSYRVQEVVDPKYDPRITPRSVRERSKSAPSFSPKNKKKANGLFKKNKKEELPVAAGKVTGPSLLWHQSTVEIYLRILQESADPEILEASAAALQNLAACQFDGSVQVRNDVRTLKGLPILVELLKLKDDKVVCSVVTALRNLCINSKNLDLVGRHAMRDLVLKLPAPNQQARDPYVSDATIGAVLGIFWEVVRSNAELTRLLHEQEGTDRLRSLAKSYPMYGKRVCKYSTQVLYLMWQHKELQDTFRIGGLKDEDFYSGTLGRKGRNAIPSVDTTTLRRPISSMGNEQPAHFRSETANKSADSIRYGQFDSSSTGRASSARFFEHSPLTPDNDRLASANASDSPRHQLNQKEPLYASVQKRDGNRRSSVGGDSWV